MNDSAQPQSEPRAGVIKSVTNPLGFFALVMLIVEGLFLVIAGRAAQSDLTLVLVISAVVIVIFAGIVAYVVFKEPSILLGADNVARLTEMRSRVEGLEKKSDELQSDLDRTKILLAESELRNEGLKNELEEFTSLESQIWALFNQGASVNLEYLLGNLKLEDNAKSREHVLGVLGVLVRKGEIEGDPLNPPGSYRLRWHN